MIGNRMLNFPAMGWQHPFSELQRMSRHLDMLTNTMFGMPSNRWLTHKAFPSVNISEDNDNYYVHAELPGIKPDDIKIEVTGRSLSISGDRTIPSEGESVRYHRREREAGKFSRIVELPSDIDSNAIDANMNNGVLRVAVAKSEAEKPKQIAIN